MCRLRDSIFLFGLLYEFLLFFDIDLLGEFLGLMIQDDQISIAHIEAGQVITRVLGVEYVFVDDECRSFGLRRGAHAYLSYSAVLAEYVVHFLRRDLVGQVAHKQDAVDFGRKSNVAALLHCHFCCCSSRL